MDVDTQNPEDNGDSGRKVWTHPVSRVPLDFYPLKRRHQEKDTPKVRIVPGPEREDYDFVSRAFG
jgi:hypothetical protein